MSRSDGRCQLRALCTPGLKLPFEFFEMRLSAGHHERFTGLTPGSRASFVVVSGRVVVAADHEPPVALDAGDAILFQADSAHFISNPGNQDAMGFLVIAPPRNPRAP